LETTVGAMGRNPGTLMAWIGPGIGPAVFEVGAAVRDAFRARDPGCGPCFTPGRPGHWLADLGLLAERRLRRAGVHRVQRVAACTYSEPERFFSYRRDGRTGRMATLIWLQPGAE
jgi:copper oxidase (laccase) domain-containing protein